MKIFRRVVQPIFWNPRGYVPSLGTLNGSHGVIARCDVTEAVGAQDGERHPLTVVELADGKIIGNLRLVATAEDVVVAGLQGLAGCPEPQNHYLLQTRRRCRLLKYRHGRALLLGGGVSGNYYHWLMDAVPRWKILQAAKYSEYDFVLLPGPSAPFEDEILDLLGVPKAKRLRCSRNFVHQFERLVVPVMPFPEWEVAAWACDWVRSLFPSGNKGPERIYISRRNATRRRLINEAELEARLQVMGFMSIQPERLSVAEQASFFNSAKCVVAAHGAGLVNMVFAPANALVVELLHPGIIVRPAIKNLTVVAGQRHALVAGERANKPMPRHEEDAEFKIDASAVVRVIEENSDSLLQANPSHFNPVALSQ
jgi:Glycosyltransferase 61